MTHLHLSRVEVDLERGLVHRPEGSVNLTTREHALLAYLAARPGTVVGRDELMREVWGHVGVSLSRAVDTAVRRLRIKLEPTPADPRHLLKVHGVGYRLLIDEPPAESRPQTPAIGREELVAEMLWAVHQGERRLALYGVAGVGVSTVAAGLAAGFRGTTWWVVHRGQLALEVAQAVGLRLRDRSGSTRIAAILQRAGPAMLVVVGPVEDAALDLLDTWLDAAPELTVVATTDAKHWARAFEVPPLPPPSDPPSWSDPAIQALLHHAGWRDRRDAAAGLEALASLATAAGGLPALLSAAAPLIEDGRVPDLAGVLDDRAAVVVETAWSSLPDAVRGWLQIASRCATPPRPEMVQAIAQTAGFSEIKAPGAPGWGAREQGAVRVPTWLRARAAASLTPEDIARIDQALLTVVAPPSRCEARTADLDRAVDVALALGDQVRLPKVCVAAIEAINRSGPLDAVATLWTRVEPALVDGGARATVLLAVLRALSWLNDPSMPRWKAELERLIDTAGDPVLQARLCILKAHAAVRDPAVGLVQAEKARTLAAQADDAALALEAEIVWCTIRALSMTDDPTTRLELAIDRARELGDLRLESRAANALGLSAFSVGRRGLAETHVADAVAINRAIGDHRASAIGAINLAVFLRHRGRLRRSYEMAVHAREGGQRVDDGALAARAGVLQLLTLLHSDDPEEVLALAAQMEGEVHLLSPERHGAFHGTCSLAHHMLGGRRPARDAQLAGRRALGEARGAGSDLVDLSEALWLSRRLPDPGAGELFSRVIERTEGRSSDALQRAAALLLRARWQLARGATQAAEEDLREGRRLHRIARLPPDAWISRLIAEVGERG